MTVATCWFCRRLQEIQPGWWSGLVRVHTLTGWWWTASHLCSTTQLWLKLPSVVLDQSAFQTLTLSLAMDANLLAPTVKLLQPWKPGRQRVRNTKHRVQIIENISTYRVNRRHGIVDEVLLFFFRCHSVPKTNITVLLIPTVASSTVPVQIHLN